MIFLKKYSLNNSFSYSGLKSDANIEAKLFIDWTYFLFT